MDFVAMEAGEVARGKTWAEQEAEEDASSGAGAMDEEEDEEDGDGDESAEVRERDGRSVAERESPPGSGLIDIQSVGGVHCHPTPVTALGISSQRRRQ